MPSPQWSLQQFRDGINQVCQIIKRPLPLVPPTPSPMTRVIDNGNRVFPSLAQVYERTGYRALLKGRRSEKFTMKHILDAVILFDLTPGMFLYRLEQLAISVPWLAEQIDPYIPYISHLTYAYKQPFLDEDDRLFKLDLRAKVVELMYTMVMVHILIDYARLCRTLYSLYVAGKATPPPKLQDFSTDLFEEVQQRWKQPSEEDPRMRQRTQALLEELQRMAPIEDEQEILAFLATT